MEKGHIMYRVVVTYQLPDGSFMSELFAHRYDIGAKVTLKVNGKWTTGIVVCLYEFDFVGTIYPINKEEV